MYIHAGSIIDPSKDPNPSTGAHLDVKIKRMYGDKAHVDPNTKQGLLSRIYLGNDDKNLKPLGSYQITSGYGPRKAPAPGASTFHKGLDYAIGAGTGIRYKGQGRYFSENGIGVLSVKDDKGNPYEIELTHTSVGTPNELGGTTVDQTPVVKNKPIEQQQDNLISRQTAKERAFAIKEAPDEVKYDKYSVLGPDEEFKSERLGKAIQGAQRQIFDKRFPG